MSPLRTHTLKTWPAPFQAVWDEIKCYEIRKDDRDFRIGDALQLREYDPDTDTYSGREMLVGVTYITCGGHWGLPEDLCVMSIRHLSRGLTS